MLDKHASFEGGKQGERGHYSSPGPLEMDSLDKKHSDKRNTQDPTDHQPALSLPDFEMLWVDRVLCSPPAGPGVLIKKIPPGGGHKGHWSRGGPHGASVVLAPLTPETLLTNILEVKTGFSEVKTMAC